ncbi:hypothetical protein BLGI_437 [Brevibacillus laterosporus GI-9]|nr:hypothetical protein BLGI_437 [Brevibacillus laterosporus GI-9]
MPCFDFSCGYRYNSDKSSYKGAGEEYVDSAFFCLPIKNNQPKLTGNVPRLVIKALKYLEKYKYLEAY